MIKAPGYMRPLHACTASRRRFIASLAATAAGWPELVVAQWEVGWRHSPTITVVGAASDARHALCDQAVAYWNRTFEELGSAFRLGTATHLDRPIDEAALQVIGNFFANVRRGGPPTPAASLLEVPGDLIVYLGHSDFVSFASHFTADLRKVVGIRGSTLPPMILPNVALNVIAHEFGHAIGLGHNSDPANLMCGRPAACRPSAFQSAQPRIFPLTDDERRLLLRMYPGK